VFSIVGVNATREFPAHFRPLVFIDGHSRLKPAPPRPTD
jgi:hypothetical protein